MGRLDISIILYLLLLLLAPCYGLTGDYCETPESKYEKLGLCSRQHCCCCVPTRRD